jgi:hypothetical protein
MGRITFSAEDLLKGQLHKEGWYRGEIAWATAKPSKDKQSQNYEYGLKYETGSNLPGQETREIKSQFNSKAIGFMKPFLAALGGMTEEEFTKKALDETAKGKEVGIDWGPELQGQKIQFRIQNLPREDNGQLTSKVTEFVPYDFKVPF